MDIKLYLKDKKIKITKSRVLILNILKEAEAPISADLIFEKCKEFGELLDLSTVYRNLELLESYGIIGKFDLGQGKYNYIMKDISHNHTLQCEFCNKSIEIDCPMLQIQEIIKSKTGFTLLQHELKLKGICDECSKEKNKLNEKGE